MSTLILNCFFHRSKMAGLVADYESGSSSEESEKESDVEDIKDKPK